MVNFSNLPEEIFGLFLKRLQYIDDVVNFGSVCKLLESIVISRKKQMRPFAPLIMLLINNHDGDNDAQLQHRFLNISKEKNFNLPIQHHTQELKCWGSPFGWLVTYGLDLNIQLLNPFTQVQISLPSQTTFTDKYTTAFPPESLVHSFVRKCMLFLSSSGPLVMAIYGSVNYMAFARPGDAAWTSLENSNNNLDVILFKGQVYATTCQGHLMLCEIDLPEPKATEFASPPNIVSFTSNFYLVEMSGDLHFERVMNELEEDDHFHYSTDLFVVYKFNFDTRSWIELSDLGDYALFVGNNTSFALSVSEYPEFKGNAIYFTDDHFYKYTNRFSDMGIYDYEEEEVEPIHLGDDVVPSRFFRPLLMMPSL